MRPMEAGCSGVMVAQILSAEQVDQVASWTKYAPVGTRGTYTSNFECGYATRPLAEHIVAANRDRWLAIQIETLSALEQVGEIAAIDGVDLLFVGPMDLSVNLQVPGDLLNPKCVDRTRPPVSRFGLPPVQPPQRFGLPAPWRRRPGR